MIAYEVVLLLVIAFLAVALGRPVVQAYAEKLKKNLSEERARELNMRIAGLEEEVQQLRQQIAAVEESTNFAMNILAKHETAAR